MQHDTTRYNTIQYNTVQYNTIQHSTAQHNKIHFNTTQHNTTKYNTTRHSTTQQNTIQYSTTQQNTIQYNTAQHNKIRYNTAQYNFQLQFNSESTTTNLSVQYLSTIHCCHPCDLSSANLIALLLLSLLLTATHSSDGSLNQEPDSLVFPTRNKSKKREFFFF